jgi:hypothetical protein
MTLYRAMIAVFVVCLISAAEVSAQHRPVPGGLLRRTPWYRLEMVAGRLRLVGTRLGLKATLTVQCPDGVAKEVLSYAATDVESASIRYEYQDAQQQWLVDIELSRRVLIRYRSSDREKAKRVEYRQPLSGPVSVAVEHDAETSQLAAPDFWRLLLADPDFCSRHLIPVLETLRTGWSLAAFGQQIERALLACAAADALLDRQMLDQAVQQLGDPEFQRRQAAERRLRDLGQRAGEGDVSGTGEDAGFVHRAAVPSAAACTPENRIRYRSADMGGGSSGRSKSVLSGRLLQTDGQPRFSQRAAWCQLHSRFRSITCS